jgi:exosome complex component RRP4
MREKRMSEKESKRTIVIPGEVIVKGNDFLPGEGTEKRGEEIVALRYGLAEENNSLVRIIPLSGGYLPRRGNVIIGKIEDLTFNGWLSDIGLSSSAFLPVSEFPRYINANELADHLDIGDMFVAKVNGVKRKGIDLTVKGRGLGKLEEGIIIEINPNKVPRIIGKEGSMVKMIKEESNCNITVGQNGFIWIRGDSLDDEMLAKKAIMFITERSFISGLTDKVQEWFKEEKGGKK